MHFVPFLVLLVWVTHLMHNCFQEFYQNCQNSTTPSILPNTTGITSKHFLPIIILIPTHAIHYPVLQFHLHSEMVRCMFWWRNQCSSHSENCVDPLLINTIIGWTLMVAATRIARGDGHNIKACIETSSSSSLLPSISASSLSWISLWPSMRNNQGTWHLWPGVNRSLQLKHSPWARPFCISSQPKT